MRSTAIDSTGTDIGVQPLNGVPVAVVVSGGYPWSGVWRAPVPWTAV